MNAATSFLVGVFLMGGSALLPAAPLIDRKLGFDIDHPLYDAYAMPDDSDPHLYHIPYSRLAIAPSVHDPKIPDFTFTYLPDGLLIQLSLKAVIDTEALKPIVSEIRKNDPEARFRYLAIDEGRFVPTIMSASDMPTTPSERTGSIIAHNQPAEIKPLAFYFNSREADLIVASLQSGGAFGINYEYTFHGTITPTRYRITMDWSEIESNVGKFASFQVISESGLREVLTRLQREAAIRIEASGMKPDLTAALDYARRLVRDRCFETAAGAGAVITGGYRRLATGCYHGEELYEFTSTNQLTTQAVAGFQMWKLCESWPQNFSYKGTDGQMQHGCPPGVYGASGTLPLSPGMPRYHGALPEPILLPSPL
jgi:hypothetical protein